MSDDEIVHDWESDCYVLHAANTHLRNERDRLRAEVATLRDMLLRSDKLTRQEWYDMRNRQLADEANAAALKETGDD